MVLQKKDFIEIQFTGRIKGGEVFDSNIKKDLEKINPEINPEQIKPFSFCLGEEMFLKGIDDFLIGKEVGEYTIELMPEEAFGKRNSKLIQMMPMKIFMQQKVNPIPGAIFNFDGRIAKILTVSGGRIMVDFNNPLAGKDLIYDIKILRKITDLKEKVNVLNGFLFKKSFKFEIKEKKLIMEVEKSLVKLVEMFKDKFKDILGLDLEVKEISKSKKEDKK
ncbi:MAG TPA: peptidylprolyl isomerase [Candidatus Paceibacterota bacterium]|nr:peptidylprolyl isomerase [Candidatus Paceibacterota bacterium]